LLILKKGWFDFETVYPSVHAPDHHLLASISAQKIDLSLQTLSREPFLLFLT
jgi:hypothetical protein